MSGERSHRYDIGDAVLVDMDGARIPGVVEAHREEQLEVRLSQPWTDETGQQAETVIVKPERLDAYLGANSSGGSGALPG